jgi:hypothetical protein
MRRNCISLSTSIAAYGYAAIGVELRDQPGLVRGELRPDFRT